jgi:hypothetical protein
MHRNPGSGSPTLSAQEQSKTTFEEQSDMVDTNSEHVDTVNHVNATGSEILRFLSINPCW